MTNGVLARIAPALERHGGLIAALFALAVFSGTLAHDLVWDDHVLLARIREGGFPSLLLREFFSGSGYYRPLVLLSLWVDDRLARAFPPIFHLTNVLLHAGNAVLVQRLLAALFSPAVALWGAVLFAVHPAASETVSFVSARTDLWAALFVLLAAWRWLCLMRKPPARPWIDWSIWAGLFVLGGLAKESAFMLPPVLLAWGLVLGFASGRGVRGWWLANRGWLVAAGLGTLFLLALRFGVAQVGIGHGVASLDAGAQRSAVNHLRLVPAIFPTYLRILLWPWPLRPYYTADQVQLDAGALLAAATALGAFALAAGRSSGRAGLLGLLWCCGFLVPVSGIVRIGGAVVAERFLYLPAAGLAMAFGALALRFGAHRAGRWTVPVAGALLITAAAALAARQSRVWKTEISFFEHTLRLSPAASPVKRALSIAYFKAGRDAEGHRVEGELFETLGLHREAAGTYERLLALPGAGGAEDHARLGRAYLGAQRHREAIAEFSRALALAPAAADLCDGLGLASQGAGDLPAAERAFREALRLRADFGPALVHLGGLLADSGRAREALPLLERHVALEPRSVTGLNDLGLLLLRERRVGEAVRALERAALLDERNPTVTFNLGMAYHAAGSREAALRQETRLRALDADLASTLRRRLQ